MKRSSRTLLFLLSLILLEGCYTLSEIPAPTYVQNPESPILQVNTTDGKNYTFDIIEEYDLPRSWLNENSIEGFVENENVEIPLELVDSIIIGGQDWGGTFMSIYAFAFTIVAFLQND